MCCSDLILLGLVSGQLRKLLSGLVSVIKRRVFTRLVWRLRPTRFNPLTRIFCVFFFYIIFYFLSYFSLLLTLVGPCGVSYLTSDPCSWIHGTFDLLLDLRYSNLSCTLLSPFVWTLCFCLFFSVSPSFSERGKDKIRKMQRFVISVLYKQPTYRQTSSFQRKLLSCTWLRFHLTVSKASQSPAHILVHLFPFAC